MKQCEEVAGTGRASLMIEVSCDDVGGLNSQGLGGKSVVWKW